MSLISRGMVADHPDAEDVRQGTVYQGDQVGALVWLFGDSFEHAITEDDLEHVLTAEEIGHTIIEESIITEEGSVLTHTITEDDLEHILD